MLIQYILISIAVYLILGAFDALAVIGANNFRLAKMSKKEIALTFLIFMLIWPYSWVLMAREEKKEDEKK